MKDTIETQNHFALAVEHIASARLELWEAVKNSNEHDGSVESSMHDLDSALSRTLRRVRM